MKALRVLGVACACVLLAAAPPHTPIYGFSLSNSNARVALEDRFLDIPSAAGALDAAAVLAAKPHYAGSGGDYKLALYVRDKLQDVRLRHRAGDADRAHRRRPKKLSLDVAPDRRPPRSASRPTSPLCRRAKAVQQASNAPPATGRRARTGHRPRPARAARSGRPDTANPAVGPAVHRRQRRRQRHRAAGLRRTRDRRPTTRLLDAHGDRPQGRGPADPLGADSAAAWCAARKRTARPACSSTTIRPTTARAAAPAYPNGPWRPLNSVQRGSVGRRRHDPGAADLRGQRAHAPGRVARGRRRRAPGRRRWRWATRSRADRRRCT